MIESLVQYALGVIILVNAVCLLFDDDKPNWKELVRGHGNGSKNVE